MNTLLLIQSLALVNAVIVALLVIVNQPQADPAFGSKDSFVRTRRGFDETLHRATIFFSVTMVALVILLHIVQ
jgi:protein translocase SecG subunit